MNITADLLDRTCVETKIMTFDRNQPRTAEELWFIWGRIKALRGSLSKLGGHVGLNGIREVAVSEWKSWKVNESHTENAPLHHWQAAVLMVPPCEQLFYAPKHAAIGELSAVRSMVQPQEHRSLHTSPFICRWTRWQQRSASLAGWSCMIFEHWTKRLGAKVDVVT